MKRLKAEFTVTLPWFTGTLEKNRVIVHVISNTCAFPAMTNKNVFYGKILFNFFFMGMSYVLL